MVLHIIMRLLFIRFLYLFFIVQSIALLHFIPEEYLEFIDSPVLILTTKSFTITNNHYNEIQIMAVSSDSTNFHAVMFQPSLLQPSEEMTIQILFLPYYVGITESLLSINTSEGSIKYSVLGKHI